MVTSGTDGYTTPADQDGNSTFDFQEVGPNSGSSQDITACYSYTWNGVEYDSTGL